MPELKLEKDEPKLPDTLTPSDQRLLQSANQEVAIAQRQLRFVHMHLAHEYKLTASDVVDDADGSIKRTPNLSSKVKPENDNTVGPSKEGSAARTS